MKLMKKAAVKLSDHTPIAYLLSSSSLPQWPRVF